MTTRAAKHRTDVDWASLRARLDALTTQSELEPSRRQEILQQRAAQLARPPAAADSGEVLRVLQLRLAHQRCALETRYITEVCRTTELTKLPGGPAHLLGLMNLRGDILPVFDLRHLLHTGQGELSVDDTRFVVMGRTAPEVVLFVEHVDEIVELKAAQLLEPIASAAAAYVRGVTADALVVIDALALLDSRELYLGDVEDSTSLEANP